MPVAGPHHPRQAGYQPTSARLEGDARIAFDALVAARGIQPTAALLRCGDPTIHRLLNGGYACRKAVERITARLAELVAAAGGAETT